MRKNENMILPEHRILIDFLNNRFEVLERESLSPDCWAYIVAEANQHRVAPLLYNKIKQANAATAIPEKDLRKLKEKYLASVYRNTNVYHQLTDLVCRMNNAKVPVILLKGAHLGEFVYKDIALRPMSDIDILVKEEHLSEAVQVAFSAGYRFFFDKDPKNDKAGQEYDYGVMSDFKHFQALIHPETKLMLEIHCFIASQESPFNISVSELWYRAQNVKLGGNSIYVLSPEDLIIHLSLHAAYDHLFEFGIGALYDIFAVIGHYENTINWDDLVSRSIRWNARQCLALTLHFTRILFKIQIPEQVFENVDMEKMASFAEKQIFKTQESGIPIHQHVIQWRNLKGFRNKMRYLKKVLMPPRSFMANRYLQPKNSRILFFRYIFRFYQALKAICNLAKFVLYSKRFRDNFQHGNMEFRFREWLVKT